MLWQPRGLTQTGMNWRRGQGAASPDNPLTLFGADLVGWWLADTDVTTSIGNVTQVLDQSGNGETLTNVGTVPFNETGFNSLPAFDFAAANQAGLENTSFSGLGTGSAGSAFFVGQMKTGTAAFGGAIVFLGNSGSNDYGGPGSAAWLTRNDTNNSIETFQNGSSRAITAISLATNYRIGSVFDGANCTHYVNNSAGSSGADSHSWGNGATHIGIGNRIIAGTFAGGTGAAWDGPISEVVILKIAPDGTQRTALDDWFKFKWGL